MLTKCRNIAQIQLPIRLYLNKELAEITELDQNRKHCRRRGGGGDFASHIKKTPEVSQVKNRYAIRQ